jgi:hypothetical protein
MLDSSLDSDLVFDKLDSTNDTNPSDIKDRLTSPNTPMTIEPNNYSY